VTLEDRDRTELYRRRLQGIAASEAQGGDLTTFLRNLEWLLLLGGVALIAARVMGRRCSVSCFRPIRLDAEGRSASRSAFAERGRLGIPRNETFSGLTSVQGTRCGTLPLTDTGAGSRSRSVRPKALQPLSVLPRTTSAHAPD
jgi:hypothetical protein